MLWHHYFHGSRGIIFVVDSADRARVDEAREELWEIMTNDELKDVPVLVFGNKQDLPKALSPAALAEKLDMGKLPRGRPWHVQGCQAVTGDGLYEGLDWLSATLKGRAHTSTSSSVSHGGR